jgi:glucokinase
VAIGVDVGGTKILGLAVGADQRILARALVPTPHPKTPDAGRALTAAIIELVRAIDGEVGEGAAVGIGVPGLVRGGSTLVYGPHLQSADRADLLLALAQPLDGRAVIVANDADMAVTAEHHAGAARGHDEVVMVTLGTGIGGGLVSRGSVVRGAGFAGEVGHMVLDVNGPHCPCGSRGCWERFASGSGLGRIAREAALAGRLGAVVSSLGGDPQSVRGEDVTAAGAGGDAEALVVLDEVGWWLARGIANLICILDPTCVIVGGGMAETAQLLLAPAQRHLGGLLEAASVREPVALLGAHFGPDAGAVGASIAARRSS